jgi:tellurite resistance protein
MTTPPRLALFPVPFFATIMGLTGFTIALHKAEGLALLNFNISHLSMWFTIACFAMISVIYVMKIIKHPEAVKKELHHPIRISFFATFSISLLLLSVVILPHAKDISFIIWAVGAVVHLGITLYILTSWLTHTHFEITHMNPAWFIPIVGNVIVPIAGVSHGYSEVSWFFFSIGILFWIALYTIVLNRLSFHHPLPEKLWPTLGILIAPPAVGFVAYIKLTGDVDSFARILYYVALFKFMFIMVQYKRLSKIEFSLSWWAYSFPVAALTIASMVMWEKLQLPELKVISYGLLAILSVIIFGLLWRTGLAISRGQICIEE